MEKRVSVEGNDLCTSVSYKPIDSHGYLLHSFSQPAHIKNSIPCLSVLDFDVLYSSESDFSKTWRHCASFSEKRGYTVSVVQVGHLRPKLIDRQLAPQTSHMEDSHRIPFAFTFDTHNHAVKYII